jgi:hypothetical protein
MQTSNITIAFETAKRIVNYPQLAKGLFYALFFLKRH